MLKLSRDEGAFMGKPGLSPSDGKDISQPSREHFVLSYIRGYLRSAAKHTLYECACDGTLVLAECTADEFGKHGWPGTA